MPDAPFHLPAREAFRTEIEATLTAIQSRAVDLSTEALVAELQHALDRAAEAGFLVGLSAAHGPELGAVVFADLTGHLEESDAEIGRRLGLEHSTVSRTLQRVRRNLGMPLRMPNKARNAAKGPQCRTT